MPPTVKCEQAGHVPGPSTASAEALGLEPGTLGFLDTFGGYTVVERIAAGAHGELYRAWEREGQRDVVLKVPLPALLSDERARLRLRREAELLARLRHPYIARFYAAGTIRGIDFLATEYVAGASLADRLADGPFPATLVVRLGVQVAGALAETHAHGIVHRDVKTSNVVVTPEGDARLIDFGLARLAGETADTPGPLRYQAPEVVRGETAGEPSDLYSFGVVLYRMAAAAWPFEATGEKELAAAILGRPPRELPRSVGPDLRRIVLKCLEKDPEDRWPSASGVAAALRGLVETRP